MLFALGVPTSSGATSLPVINIDWNDHHHGWGGHQHFHGGCNCYEAQDDLEKHQHEVTQCQYGNHHACHEAREDQMKGKVQRDMQCWQMCQHGGYRPY